jgi:hypothetical protein
MRGLWKNGIMDARGWSVGAAAFLAVGFVIWLPKGAVGQTLAGQAAATGVAADLSSRSTASGVNSLARLKKALAGAGPDQPWVDAGSVGSPVGAKLAGPALGSGNPQTPGEAAPQATDVASIKVLSQAKSLAPLKGWIVSAEGKIEDMEPVNGKLVFRIVPASDSGFGSKDRLIFETLAGEKSTARKGDHVRAYGAYSFENHTRKGIRMLFFDGGQIVSGAALAAAELEAAAAQGAVGSFQDPLAGWKLTGTASGLGEGTAVFVGPDEKPKFLAPGETFGPGFKVISVKPGEAVLEKEDKILTVIAW